MSLIINLYYSFFYLVILFTIEVIELFSNLFRFKATLLSLYYFVHYLFRSEFLISKQAIQGESLSDQNFTYGFTPSFTARAILKEAGLSKGDMKTVYDLGAGSGRFILFGALEFKHSHFVAVEYIREFTRNVSFFAQRFHVSNVLVSDGDLLDVKLTHADIVYIAGTCFDQMFIAKLNERLKDLQQGAIVVTLSYPLISDRLRVMKQKKFLFSWGRTTVFFHKVKF